MSAREKIENLTNSWYGFAFVTGIWSVFQNGIGLSSLLVAAASTIFSFGLTYFLGSRLRARSSLTRTFLMVASVVSMALGALGVFQMGSAFFQSWSLSLLSSIGFTLVSVRMNFKSFRVLTDSSVAAYFG